MSGSLLFAVKSIQIYSNVGARFAMHVPSDILVEGQFERIAISYRNC